MASLQAALPPEGNGADAAGADGAGVGVAARMRGSARGALAAGSAGAAVTIALLGGAAGLPAAAAEGGPADGSAGTAGAACGVFCGCPATGSRRSGMASTSSDSPISSSSDASHKLTGQAGLVPGTGGGGSAGSDRLVEMA